MKITFRLPSSVSISPSFAFRHHACGESPLSPVPSCRNNPAQWTSDYHPLSWASENYGVEPIPPHHSADPNHVDLSIGSSCRLPGRTFPLLCPDPQVPFNKQRLPVFNNAQRNRIANVSQVLIGGGQIYGSGQVEQEEIKLQIMNRSFILYDAVGGA